MPATTYEMREQIMDAIYETGTAETIATEGGDAMILTTRGGTRFRVAVEVL